MRTRTGDAIARAIASAQGAQPEALADLPDSDADELAARLARVVEGLSPGEAMGEALAIGIEAGREIERVRALCDDSQALRTRSRRRVKSS